MNRPRCTWNTLEEHDTKYYTYLLQKNNYGEYRVANKDKDTKKISTYKTFKSFATKNISEPEKERAYRYWNNLKQIYR